MPGIKVHLLLGALFYPVFYISYFWFSKIDPITMYGINIVGLSYVLFIIGCDLPDIDADFAPIRYFTQSLLPVVFIYLFYKVKFIHDFFERFNSMSNSFLIISAVLSGLAVGYFLKILKHRGFLHSLRFSFFYACIIFFTVRWGMHLSDEISIFLALSGFFGVTVHLVFDKEVKL